jgi:methionine sulfoxide reductase catalytic subunit
MLIRRRPGWWMPESAATPEHVFLNRRAFLAASGVSVAGSLLPGSRAFAEDADPTADLYPAARNDAYMLDREITPEKYNLAFNNFYEFGSHKQIANAAQGLQIRPWQVKIDGDVEAEMTLDIDDLIRKVTLEERLYRHRCVEAWSMAVPWTGFAMSKLVALARPLSSAKYVRMETFEDPDMAPGQRQVWYPWPYVEGLTIEEAGNDLTFLVTGAYGKPVAKQMGAPLRLATPWKYGFKSIKSIVRFTFTAERPVNFWQEIQPSEYGFWANVNPEVSHPRWSQASEQVLGTSERVPTLLYNGYGDQVASLYSGYEGEKLFM